MMTLIRAEETRDIAMVQALHAAAFPNGNEARLVEVLRQRGKAAISLVAELNGEVVGHVLFSAVELSRKGSIIRGLGLAPLAVMAAYRRQGIGEQLVREGLTISRTLGHKFVVVLGDPAYYSRIGFERASLRGLQNEYGCDEPFRTIVFSDTLPIGGGMVRYASEFAELNV
jgi:putative acetyltransferase